MFSREVLQLESLRLFHQEEGYRMCEECDEDEECEDEDDGEDPLFI